MPAGPLTIALIAGEASGDNLAAPMMRAIKAREPDVRFVGIGGPNMISAGLESWFDLEELSVNGFVDPLKRLPRLIHILRESCRRILASGAACFVGVDFNFFNLLLERMLKRRGVRTIHYVSPTVWAWRKGRIRGIRRSVDRMMTLYPFELEVYREHGIDARFVGHPKADEIEPAGESAKCEAKTALGIAEDATLVALLPGSRGSEVRYSGPDFLDAARVLLAHRPRLKFAIAAANEARQGQLAEMAASRLPESAYRITRGNALQVMTAADVVLVNSGTATLEAMLLRRPMVMSYRLGPVTYAIVSRLVSTPYFALPNILAGEQIVPELIQDDASPAALAAAVAKLLEAGLDADDCEAFDRIHAELRCDAGETAAEAVLSLLERAS